MRKRAERRQIKVTLRPQDQLLLAEVEEQSALGVPAGTVIRDLAAECLTLRAELRDLKRLALALVGTSEGPPKDFGGTSTGPARSDADDDRLELFSLMDDF